MCDFINKINKLKYNYSFCMPGHNRHNIFNNNNLFILDKTEHIETGNLYENNFPIKNIQKSVSKYYGVKYSYLSTNGSTACIISLILTYVGNNGILIADSNCHKSILNAITIFNIKVFFTQNKIIDLYNITGNINIINFKLIIKNVRKKYLNKKIAILITNPTYYGVIIDMVPLINIAKIYNIPLIVDQAHAAHFQALNIKNAVQLGATASIISLHKTLPCLTQSAIILTNIKNDKIMYYMSLFSTSSPSYLILSSIEKGIYYMEKSGDDFYLKCSFKAKKLKKQITNNTIFKVLNNKEYNYDPLRLTISCYQTGYSAKEIFKILYYKYKIEAEMHDLYNIVFILAGINRNFNILLNALIKFKKRISIIKEEKITLNNVLKFNITKLKLITNEKKVCIKKSIGKIASRPYIIYPPGTALILPGQIITLNHILFIQKINNDKFIWIKK